MPIPSSVEFSGPVWEGIYKDFADVPPSAKGFNTDDWIASCRRQLSEAKIVGCRYQEYLLPAIGALIAAERGNNPLVVLDIGGERGMVTRRYEQQFHPVESVFMCSRMKRFAVSVRNY